MYTEFSAGLFDELDALYPDSDAAQGISAYKIAACNGMVAGVHIMLSGLTPGLPVTVEISGPHHALKLFELLPLPVEVNTGARLRSAYLHNDVNETVIRKAPFYVYDVLKPIFNLFIPSGVSAALALKTPVEYVRAQETQVWTIKLTHAGFEKTLTFTVEAYPARVPKASKDTFEYVNWMSYDNVAKFHGLVKGTPAYDKMLSKYFRLCAYERQNIVDIPVTAYMRFEDGECHLDEAGMLKLITLAREQGIERFQGMGLCGRARGQGDNDRFYNSLDHDRLKSHDDIVDAFRVKAFDCFDNCETAKFGLTGELIPGAGEASLRKACKVLNAFLTRYDLKDVWYQCMLDEPNDALADTYRIISAIFKEELPGVKRFEPVLASHKLDGCVDVWCPSVDVYETDREYYEDRVKQGDELYVYTCLTPGGRYCNRMLDMQRLRQVYLFWAPAKYRSIKGFLHWGLNQYPNGDDPYARSAVMFSEQLMEFHPKLPMFLPAGDFAIFYPGDNMPYTTARAEAHRLGLEDLELLRKLPEETREKLVANVFNGFAEYEPDIARYRSNREALIQASV